MQHLLLFRAVITACKQKPFEQAQWVADFLNQQKCCIVSFHSILSSYSGFSGFKKLLILALTQIKSRLSSNAFCLLQGAYYRRKIYARLPQWSDSKLYSQCKWGNQEQASIWRRQCFAMNRFTFRISQKLSLPLYDLARACCCISVHKDTPMFLEDKRARN